MFQNHEKSNSFICGIKIPYWFLWLLADRIVSFVIYLIKEIFMKIFSICFFGCCIFCLRISLFQSQMKNPVDDLLHRQHMFVNS